MNMTRHAYWVLWSKEDQEYVGLCAEFPALSWLDEEQVAALEGIVRLVRDVVADMEASGEPIPEPLSQKNFSSKISLRTTPAVHRELALSAAENGVSLNRLINALTTGWGVIMRSYVVEWCDYGVTGVAQVSCTARQRQDSETEECAQHSSPKAAVSGRYHLTSLILKWIAHFQILWFFCGNPQFPPKKTGRQRFLKHL